MDDVIKDSIYEHEMFESYNINSSYGMDHIRRVESLWQFEKDKVNQVLQEMTTEGLLQKNGNNEYWASTNKGKIEREKHWHILGKRHESLINQKDYLLEDLIIALIASCHRDELSTDFETISESTIPIYLCNYTKVEIQESIEDLIDRSLVLRNNVFKIDLYLSTDGHILYEHEIVPKLGILSPKTILASSKKTTPSFSGLNLSSIYADNLKYRWEEAERCAQARSWLASLIIYGSIIEGVLLTKIEENVEQANNVTNAPKYKDGKVKKLEKWTLENLINVAIDLGWIDNSLGKYSHALRDNRNLVHPSRQIKERSKANAQTVHVSKSIVESVINSLIENIR